MSQRPRLGELLVDAGVIGEEQLAQALSRQQQNPLRLGKTLLQMQALDEETLTRTLARQLSVPVAWLRGKRIRGELLELVPRELIERHRCLPVQLDDRGEKTLLLAMEDPSDIAAIDAIATSTGLAVRPVLAAPSELDDAIARHFEIDPGDSLSQVEFVDDEDSRPDLLSIENKAPAPTVHALPPLQAMSPPAASQPEATAVADDLVLRALTQLLVEKGVFTREELIERLGALAGKTPDPSEA